MLARRQSMTKPLLIAMLLCAALSALAAAASAQNPPQAPLPMGPLTLEAAMERALAANPAIAAARFRRVTALAGIGVARERLNPEARVEFERETPTRAYSVAMPLETGGKRGRRIAVAEAGVLTSEAELAQTMAEIRAAVRRAYFARLIAESRFALLQEIQAITVRARDAAQARFDAGSAPRLEVLQADLARADAENQATAVLGETVATRATLNALLALPADSALPLSASLDAGFSTGPEAAVTRARTTSAELALLDRRLDEQRARIALAHAMQVADITPEGTITRGQPEFATGWRAAVAVVVPLFTRHRAGVLLEEATLAQLTAEREGALARITGEVTAAAVIAGAQRQLYLRYRDQIVPQALQVEQMAEDSYRLGQTGISAYLQALQASRDVRLRALQSGSDFQTALSDLERAIGATLP
jgi:cobalt-zinc-cadmium efflux system outer membrane protein